MKCGMIALLPELYEGKHVYMHPPIIYLGVETHRFPVDLPNKTPMSKGREKKCPGTAACKKSAML
jgi:hypothetical protein